MAILTAIVSIVSFCSLPLFSSSANESYAAGEKRVSIYSVVANYSLPVIEHDGREYAALLEALEPLGRVTATTVGPRWQLRYNNVEADFIADQASAQIRGASLDLPEAFLLDQGRGLVPLAALGTVMSRILGGPVAFHEASRRVFVGNVAVHFTAQVSKGAILVMNFTAPVNPMIATEPGKLRMVFSHEPLVPPGSPALTFDSKTIPSALYEEDNGEAAITVNGTAPLFAKFSNGGKTITIAAAGQPAAQGGSPVSPPTAASSAPASGAQSGGGGAAPTTGVPLTYFAVVDASHGGSERGAALSSQLAEKDVTLAFARLLRRELEARGLATLVLRDGDSTLTLDQRASLTNVAHPLIYICLHASSEGHGVRLYTALVSSEGANSGPFLDWDTAQFAFLPASQAAAAGLGAELQRRKISVRVLMAPLRPLNNIAAAAVAIEVAPPPEGTGTLISSAYQELVAGGVAAGVLLVRDKLGAGLRADLEAERSAGLGERR
jgi:N-acetylmuramoyl-L-alanine amidase